MLTVSEQKLDIVKTKHFLAVDNVSHYYTRGFGFTQSLSDISFNLQVGEILSIVGSSGCGKSTLLRIVAGLIAPSQGKVAITNKSPIQYRFESGIGFAFQKPVLFPWKTVLENILLPLEIRSGKMEQKERVRALSLLQILGISGFEDSYPSQLSGGMLQRAAIARALMSQPKLLLLDEPFSALDEITRENLWVDFSQIWRQQKLSVLLVTHSRGGVLF
jgi:NitT/TauT family transport system ATP-binding protein